MWLPLFRPKVDQSERGTLLSSVALLGFSSNIVKGTTENLDPIQASKAWKNCSHHCLEFTIIVLVRSSTNAVCWLLGKIRSARLDSTVVILSVSESGEWIYNKGRQWSDNNLHYIDLKTYMAVWIGTPPPMSVVLNTHTKRTKSSC